MAVRKKRRPHVVPRWSPKLEDKYVQRTWAVNRRIVLWTFYPSVFCFGLLYAWHFLKAPGYPPLLIWAVLLGSFAVSMGLALVFWRCPKCNEILYRTSKSGAGLLFWLSDPEDCPYCGVKINKYKDLD